MKWLVCIAIFILNISRNGKASLDSLTEAVTNGFLEDITTNSVNLSCYRPCKFHVKPKQCHFIFKVKPSILDDRAVIAINDHVPGPPINVCVNDIIVVEVQNKIPDQDLAIHWHGVDQVDTPHMDGVPMVTQCPINYGSTYRYAFRASKPGTYFYHAHSVSHQSDGVFGALIVNQPSPLEPHYTLYDYDRSKENTLLLSAVFPILLTGSLEDLSEIKPTSLEINGKQNYKIFMNEGYAYRLRLVNAIAVDCPISVSFDEHESLVIAADSSPLKPVAAKAFLLYPGERMDVVVRSQLRLDGSWAHVNGRGKCEGMYARAAILSTGGNYTSIAPGAKAKKRYLGEDKSEVNGQTLESIKDSTNNGSPIRSLYLGIDQNVVQLKETDSDFRYVSDAIPQKPFYPVSFFLRDNGVIQINGKNLLYPNAPILTHQRDVSEKSICLVGSESLHPEPQCVQILQASHNEVVELALVNQGSHSNNSYTFHIHGNVMEVLATGHNSNDKPLYKDEFTRLDRDGQISRNKINPPLKDTIVVPNKGYTIARVKFDSTGSWLLECRSCGISSLPTAILINVLENVPIFNTKSLHKCGNYRPPDVLLN